jgi:hypothetical protein
MWDDRLQDDEAMSFRGAVRGEVSADKNDRDAATAGEDEDDCNGNEEDNGEGKEDAKECAQCP